MSTIHHPAPADKAPDDMPSAAPLPLPIIPAPDPVDRALSPLLDETFARAWADEPAAQGDPGQGVRRRLLDRLAASRAIEAPMVTAAWRRLPVSAPQVGVLQRVLYEADEHRPRRPGEPLRARLIELQPGSLWQPALDGRHHEWLVLRGAVQLGALWLGPRDYHAVPAGADALPLQTPEGAWLFLRESDLPAAPGAQPQTVRDADAGWPEYAPGIRRRVLWQQGGQAALLYLAQPGASVPQHRHGHDEECLMLQGELFLDDRLLQPGDYQLAPAGTGHHTTVTDTGVVIYAHGDMDLQFTG